MKDLKPYRLTVPTFSGCRTHEPHRCQRTCLVPSSSCVDDRPLRMSWPKQPDGPPNGCSDGSEERRRPPQKGKMRTRTPKDVRNAPAPLRTSPTPVGPTASGETPSLPRTRPAASICRIDGSDRRALPQADKGITGAWDSAGPHRPQPTAWSNAAAAATTAASCSRQGPLPRRQHAADPDTDRSTGRTARGQPAQTRPATGGPPPRELPPLQRQRR
jgi:hypothetical protein